MVLRNDDATCGGEVGGDDVGILESYISQVGRLNLSLKILLKGFLFKISILLIFLLNLLFLMMRVLELLIDPLLLFR